MIGDVASAIGAVASLFGKKKGPNAADNIDLQALGARRAADKYGFNPLTLLQYGQPGGSLASASDVPPLASIEFLADAISGIEKEFNGDAERQRQADQLNLDLARINLERARSGVVVAPPSAAQSAGQGPSPLGRTAVMVHPVSVTPGAINETARGNDVRNVPRGPNSDPAGAVPLEVPYTMPDGSTTMGPNPDGADIEQFAYTGAMKAKSLAERYSRWWWREAPPRMRSDLQNLTGKDEKRRKDAKRSAYGPQQSFWPF